MDAQKDRVSALGRAYTAADIRVHTSASAAHLDRELSHDADGETRQRQLWDREEHGKEARRTRACGKVELRRHKAVNERSAGGPGPQDELKEATDSSRS